MEHLIPDAAENFIAHDTLVSNVTLDGGSVVRVEKDGRSDEFDTDTVALAKGVDFHDGIIEVEVRSRLLSQAADFARGFLGIVFRASGTCDRFESFYVRPTNGRRCEDPVRRSHGCQYFSFPGYTFAYFRKRGIDVYEAPADIDLDEWICIRAEVEGAQARFYVDDMERPALEVADLKLGPDARGGVGIYIDTGTEGFVRNLCVDAWD